MGMSFNRGLVAIVVCLLALAQLINSPTLAQGPGGSVEQTLRDLTQAWSKAPLTHDTAVLQRIWAADFIYVLESGETFDKTKGIADEAKSTDKLTSATATNLRIRVYRGSAAVVIGDYEEIGRDKDGKAFDRKSRFTNVWVLRNGTWQCVNGHSSFLGPK